MGHRRKFGGPRPRFAEDVMTGQTINTKTGRPATKKEMREADRVKIARENEEFVRGKEERARQEWEKRQADRFSEEEARVRAAEIERDYHVSTSVVPAGGWGYEGGHQINVIETHPKAGGYTSSIQSKSESFAWRPGRIISKKEDIR